MTMNGIEGVDYRMVPQRRRFQLQIQNSGGGWNQTHFGSLAEFKVAYHAALVALDAGLFKAVVATTAWIAYNEGGAFVDATALVQEG